MSERIRKGTQFRSVVADDNALWEVTKALPEDLYECIVVNEPIEINGKTYDGDHAGYVDVFMGEEIRRILAMEDFFINRRDKMDAFYESLALGGIWHYHNAFGQFLRCEVVLDAEGKKLLQPIAMVGAWRDGDLPHRWPSGSISVPYHAKHVLERTGAWRCDPATIYEHPDFTDEKSKGIDPTKLDPIELRLPEPDEHERREIAKERLLMLVNEVTTDRHKTPDERFETIARILDER